MLSPPGEKTRRTSADKPQLEPLPSARLLSTLSSVNESVALGKHHSVSSFREQTLYQVSAGEISGSGSPRLSVGGGSGASTGTNCGVADTVLVRKKDIGVAVDIAEQSGEESVVATGLVEVVRIEGVLSWAEEATLDQREGTKT